MGALVNLWHSERGLLALGGLLAATVLVALGKMTVAEWREFCLWIFGIYTGGKTASAIADSIKTKAPNVDKVAPATPRKRTRVIEVDPAVTE